MKDEKEIVRAGMLRDYLELPEEELKNIANERGFDPILVHDYKPHVIEKIEKI
jgi:HD superfamily phosphohydrolase YqeK